jgi:uncharacterized protein YqgC (DUF456 family)
MKQTNLFFLPLLITCTVIVGLVGLSMGILPEILLVIAGKKNSSSVFVRLHSIDAHCLNWVLDVCALRVESALCAFVDLVVHSHLQQDLEKDWTLFLCALSLL